MTITRRNFVPAGLAGLLSGHANRPNLLSRASVLTGQHMWRHGIRDFATPLSAGQLARDPEKPPTVSRLAETRHRDDHSSCDNMPFDGARNVYAGPWPEYSPGLTHARTGRNKWRTCCDRQVPRGFGGTLCGADGMSARPKTCRGGPKASASQRSTACAIRGARARRASTTWP